MYIEKSNDIANLRNRLLNDALLGIAAVSVPALAISLARISDFGWRPFFMVQIVLVVSMWVVWLLRQRIPYGGRASFLLMTLASAGVGGYMQFGLMSAGGLFILMLQFLAALLLGGAAALRVGGFVAAALISIAWGASSGILTFPPDVVIEHAKVKNWAIIIYVIVCYGAVVAFLGWRMFGELIAQQHELREINEQLILRTREAEAADRLKGEILANLSHELRTPLNGVLGMADLLQSSEVDDDRRTWLGELKTSAAQLGDKINRMMDFARLTANKVKLSSGPFAFHELLENSVRSIRPRAAAKGLALALRVAPEIPQAVATDGQRLQQVVGELLDNAVKFTKAGSIDLNVRMATPHPDDGRHWISLTIKDSGPGIAQHAQQSIFQAFYQTDGSATRGVGGNGLGLAICQRVTTLLGGSIGVVSDAAGSIFTLTIPLEKVSAEYLQ